MIVLTGGSVLKAGEWTPKTVVLRDGAIERVLNPDDAESTLFIQAPDARVYDATGKYLMPGAIDVHVHFRFPGGEHKENWEAATQAAYAGGITYVCDMPNNTPPVVSVVDLEEKRIALEATFPNAIAHGLYIAATETNLREIITAADSQLICGVKVYYGTSTGDLTMNNRERVIALFNAGISVPIVIHAEDDEVIAQKTEEFKSQDSPEIHSQVRPREAAVSALKTIIECVRETGATNVHITHITTKEEVELIRAAKKEGLIITCDVTPHHLILSTDDYAAKGNDIRVNPPVRDQEDAEALWEGLRDGTIDIVASDHAPHTVEEKHAKSYWDVPSGVPGVQTLLPVLIDGALHDRIPWKRVQELVCRNPVSRFHLIGRGMINEGAISDIVVIDPEAETHVTNAAQKSACGWTPFDGRVFNGAIVATFASNDVTEYSEKPQLDLAGD